MLSFLLVFLFDPRILFISVTRLFPLYYVLFRFNVDDQFNILKGEVNFWIQSEQCWESREQGIGVFPFLK